MLLPQSLPRTGASLVAPSRTCRMRVCVAGPTVLGSKLFTASKSWRTLVEGDYHLTGPHGKLTQEIVHSPVKQFFTFMD